MSKYLLRQNLYPTAAQSKQNSIFVASQDKPEDQYAGKDVHIHLSNTEHEFKATQLMIPACTGSLSSVTILCRWRVSFLRVSERERGRGHQAD